MSAKPKLLIVEVWQVGDLAIATPFIQKVCEHYEVTLLAKPFAADLQARFWPQVRVVPFNAPWTAFAFNRKYRLFSWPWRAMFSIWRQLRREKFDVALSARWDPRDHFFLWLSGAAMRLGFPRIGSRVFLTHPLLLPEPLAHRYESWRILARALNLDLAARGAISFPPPAAKSRTVLVHTGAAQTVRIWPLENYRQLVARLRRQNYRVNVICNPEQLDWWRQAGEAPESPRTIAELLRQLDQAAVFVGNDSGPGHLAAFCGLPTFSFFGPQVPEWFVPLHPGAEVHPGKACPYKPCSDYCRFSTPHCLWDVSEAEAGPMVEAFVRRHLGETPAKTQPALNGETGFVC